MADMTRAVVTGAAGYVGQNLIRQLLADGIEVVTVDARPLGDDLVHGSRHVLADVRRPDEVAVAIGEGDTVFHLAASITLFAEDDAAWDVNVNGPAVVARAALEQGVRRMVHCSSVHAYDLAQSKEHLDETSPRAGAGRPVYDRSKYAGEVEVRRVIDDGLDAVIVNPTGIYGPIEHQASRVNSILRVASKGRAPFSVGGGFDFVDVRDVALGMIAAAAKGRTGENYLLTGHRSTGLDLAQRAARANGHRGPKFALPLPMLRVLAPVGEWVSHRIGTDVFTRASISTLAEDPIVDGSKAKRELGYEARSVDDTVRDLVRSFD